MGGKDTVCLSEGRGDRRPVNKLGRKEKKKYLWVDSLLFFFLPNHPRELQTPSTNNPILYIDEGDRSKIQQLSYPGMALVFNDGTSLIDSGLLSSFYRFSQGAQVRPNNTGK